MLSIQRFKWSQENTRKEEQEKNVPNYNFAIGIVDGTFCAFEIVRTYAVDRTEGVEF